MEMAVGSLKMISREQRRLNDLSDSTNIRMFEFVDFAERQRITLVKIMNILEYHEWFTEYNLNI